ncbi:MAG TPA: hypothetical protein VIK12_05150 [Pengzhenrongella sp.]
MSEEVKPRVLPIYFVADESGSMAEFVGMLKEGLTGLYDAMQGEPLAASKVRFSVIGFSDGVTEHLSLADLTEIERDDMPRLGSFGSTSYLRLFEDLTTRIPRDLATLKGEYEVFRPAVFFLTDGMPTSEGWEAAYERVKALPAQPNVLAFGVRGADEGVLSRLASQPEWASITEEGADTGRALVAFMVALTRSVVLSARAIAAGESELVVERPALFRIATPLV